MRVDSNGVRKSKRGPGKKSPYYCPPSAFGGPDIVWRRKRSRYSRGVPIIVGVVDRMFSVGSRYIVQNSGDMA